MRLQPKLNLPQHKTASQTPQITKKKRLNILGTSVDTLTREETLNIVASLMTSMHRHHVVTVNSLLLLEAQKRKALQNALNDASLVIPDSSGVSWAAMTLHYSKLNRFPGIDMAFEICAIAEKMGIPVYLLGGQPGVAKKASRYLYKAYPSLLITGMRDGFFKESDKKSIIDDMAQSRARLVLVALGMPKQELWIHQNLNQLPPAVYIGVGGTFDVWAGSVSRAPELMRQSGFEWLYRLGQEPSRWKRISQLPKFALKVLGSKF